MVMLPDQGSFLRAGKRIARRRSIDTVCRIQRTVGGRAAVIRVNGADLIIGYRRVARGAGTKGRLGSLIELPVRRQRFDIACRLPRNAVAGASSGSAHHIYKSVATRGGFISSASPPVREIGIQVAGPNIAATDGPRWTAGAGCRHLRPGMSRSHQRKDYRRDDRRKIPCSSSGISTAAYTARAPEPRQRRSY